MASGIPDNYFSFQLSKQIYKKDAFRHSVTNVLAGNIQSIYSDVHYKVLRQHTTKSTQPFNLRTLLIKLKEKLGRL